MESTEELIGIHKRIVSSKKEDSEDKKLRESEDKYRSLVSHIPDVIWTTDKDSRVVFISNNVESITGYKPEEEYDIGKHISWFDRIHPEDVETVKYYYYRLIGKKQPYNVEYRFKRRDGKWIWVYDRAVATYEKYGVKYADGLLSDITERKQAEEENKRLKEKYESVLKNIPDTIYSGLPDKTCTMTFISERYQEWTGYSTKYFYKDPWAWPRTVHPEDRERELRTYNESCRKKQPYLSEYRIFHKDTGQIRWVRDHGLPVIDDKGNLILFDGVITDITDRKHAAAEIERLKEKYESVIRNIPVTIYSSLPDETSTTTFISERYFEWTGYSPDDFYNNRYTWSKSIHPDDRDSVLAAYIKAYKTNTAYNNEYRVINKDTGIVRWVSDHGVPVNDAKGNILYYDGIILDITERRKAEQALKRSEEFNSNLLSKSPNPIVVIKSDLSISYVNPALEKLAGYLYSEIVGKKPPYPWSINKVKQPVRNDFNSAFIKGISRHEALYKKKNGDWFWAAVTSAPLQHSDGSRYLLVNWTDITEQKRLRDDMQYYIKEITKAQETERNRISRELHDETAQSLADLCTDVDTIMMKESLSKGVINRLDKLRGKIDDMLEEVRRLSHELKPGLLDQFGLIPSIETLAEDVNKENGLSCRLEIAGQEKRLSNDAESLLFRIIQEAIRNVRKHANATEVIIIVNFGIDTVWLSIKDDGKGFEVPKVFGEFARKGKLGIMGMHERAYLLGGDLEIKSSIGKGTDILVELPIKSSSSG